MAALLNEHSQNETPLIARNWVKILAQYREPNTVRSVFELLVTLIPFLSLWSLAWWLLTDYPWMAFAVALSNGLFLVRIFIVKSILSNLWLLVWLSNTFRSIEFLSYWFQIA